jgi:hypothetical protein
MRTTYGRGVSARSIALGSIASLAGLAAVNQQNALEAQRKSTPQRLSEGTGHSTAQARHRWNRPRSGIASWQWRHPCRHGDQRPSCAREPPPQGHRTPPIMLNARNHPLAMGRGARARAWPLNLGIVPRDQDLPKAGPNHSAGGALLTGGLSSADRHISCNARTRTRGRATASEERRG